MFKGPQGMSLAGNAPAAAAAAAAATASVAAPPHQEKMGREVAGFEPRPTPTKNNKKLKNGHRGEIMCK